MPSAIFRSLGRISSRRSVAMEGITPQPLSRPWRVVSHRRLPPFPLAACNRDRHTGCCSGTGSPGRHSGGGLFRLLPVFGFRPHQPVADIDQLGQFVGVTRPPLVGGVEHRRPRRGVHHHLHELVERQRVADVVPRPVGAGQVAPNGPPMLAEDPDEGNYSPSSIPANSAHCRHMAA
jgi:hypothetical protein